MLPRYDIWFHVTHYGGCAIPFNKDTFHPNVDVVIARKEEEGFAL